MSVKLGHAVYDENGKAIGGKAGDQTGKEICTRKWYSRTWNVLLRAKDSSIANKIAKAMEQACDNDNIGYDQKERTTLYTQAKAVGWDLSKIKVKCETDCSALVAVCVNCAGVTVSKDIYTGNERKALLATGKFEALTDSKYLTSDSYLKRGDILLDEGHHTAVVLDNGINAESKGTSVVSNNTEKEQVFVSVELLLLQKGDKNNSVLSLQNMLIHKWNISCGEGGADSSFGNDTENAIKTFQKMKGLTSDGVCGKNTWLKVIRG